MASDPFVHLHVASGHSMRYGVDHPRDLVARAADHGMSALALTDRDGVYGAVKFVKACTSAGIQPLLGVDVAVAGSAAPAGDPAVPESRASGPRRRSSPARGGAFVADGHPRVTLLAAGARGWASLCRLISATHLAGERGAPVTTHELIAEHADRLVLLLGPTSDVGRALHARRLDVAARLLDRWRAIVAPGDLVIELVHHRASGDGAFAARMLGFATQHGIPAVLANAVRYADRADAPVADVLDAARRLVVLDARHVDRRTAEGYLKSGKEMAELADEIGRFAGLPEAARELLARTRRLAERCYLDPHADLGIGSVHFPDLGDAAPDGDVDGVLRRRCLDGVDHRHLSLTRALTDRLDDELSVIRGLGYAAYFTTVADVVSLIRDMGVRCAARGSGAGSLVNFLLGISDVDPMRYGLLMERFLSPLRGALPDIDVDVESARRTEVYERILARFGAERCVCVSMMDTYRARHAIRDVGAALGLPPAEIDTIAKAFPHIRASQLSRALVDLPELRASGLGELTRTGRLHQLFRVAERLDGLPRHIALHPCGVVLSDRTLLDRTPVEASWLGFPMSQFDKDDVEDLGLLKLDVLGVRMQSAIAHALDEVARVDGEAHRPDIDAIARDDPATFALVQSTRTLGCFQIESPGQRELVGKFAPETFEDLIIDISLFRPGPVKTDMVRPFLEARQGWRDPTYLHPVLEPILAETWGVVVFHEQVLRIVAAFTGCSLAEADEVRRALGDPLGQDEARVWFHPRALREVFDLPTIDAVWRLLRGFASFGFCKAHAAAFALPTYQSAWLKAHHPAAFLAGVLTHDPGMYPKRLLLEEARRFGIAILPLDVNVSDRHYLVERVGLLDEPPPQILDAPPRPRPDDGVPDDRAHGIRLALSDVKGITDAEIDRIVAGRPYGSLSDFWHRAAVARPIAERLVVAGAFDSLYGLGSTLPVRRRGRVSRRDLLLQVAELDTWTAAAQRTRPKRRRAPITEPPPAGDVRASAARQSRAPVTAPPSEVQLTLDLGDAPEHARPTGLPEMSAADRVRAELDVLGLDASHHVLAFYEPVLAALAVTRSRDLLACRSRAGVLVAGVKVATQTPPIRSGRRVVFVTLDDATGPVDATFFEDAQAGFAATVFHSWLLVIRGTIRRTGPRGVSLLASGCWDLTRLHELWTTEGDEAMWDHLGMPPHGYSEDGIHGAAASRATRPVMSPAPRSRGRRYANGTTVSDYADVRPAGGDTRSAPRRLWHSSPGSSGG